MIIVDLDGTLCDNTHRRHLVPPKELAETTKAWVLFNKACIDDKPIGPMVELLTKLSSSVYWYEVIFVTGRGEQARSETEAWLRKNISWFCHNDYELIMRPVDENRSPAEFKHDTFKSLGLGKNDIVLDDDPRIIKMVHKNFGAIVINPPSRCSAVLRDNQK